HPLVSVHNGSPLCMAVRTSLLNIQIGGSMTHDSTPFKERLVEVVDGTAQLENIMNQIIEGYCEPCRDRFTFFWTVVLDSSVMTLGGKVRVVSAIADQLDTKIESGKLSSVLSLRNAF